METIIETQDLSKTYGNIQAVNHIHLHVPTHSVYGFLGPNGSGKTTTIRMLLGLIRPGGGKISLFGSEIQPGNLAHLRRIGSLVEAPSYYPHLTGRENLDLIAILRGESERAVERALEIVNLRTDANRLVKQYSLGMRQRLGLAIALLGKPDLLILDEPTNGLDPAGIHEIRALISRLAQETGTTIFVSSHLLNEVELIATQIGILNQGKLIFEGSPELLRSAYPEQIMVRTDRPEAAQSMLKTSGWRPAHTNELTLMVPIDNERDAARLNHQLVQNGFSVFELSRHQISLEDIFLSMTEA